MRYMIFITLWFVSWGPSWQIAVIGDTQSNWEEVSLKAPEAMRQRRVDLAVNLGDIWKCGIKSRWETITDAFDVVVPTCWVIGNHELKVCGRRKYRPHLHRRWWRAYFTRETYARCDRSRTDAPGAWDNYRLLLLDNATPAISRRQLDWLREELEAADHRNVIIFSHRPLPCRSCRGRWYRRMDPMPLRWRNVELRNLLDEHAWKIIAAFHGHWHGYREYMADGVPTWCTGGGGGDPEPGQKHHWLLVTVWGPLIVSVTYIPLGRRG